MSVTAAVLVPTTVTVAPITGSLSPSETTVPEILVCATAALTHRNSVAKHISSFLFIKNSFIFDFFIWLVCDNFPKNMYRKGLLSGFKA